MAFHLIYNKLNIKFEYVKIFELDKVNLVFKPTFTLEFLCIMIIACIF